MGGIFACPECGRALAVGGLTPGREVRCPACSTRVEVPYLPRAAGWKRGRRGRGRKRPAWWDSKLLRAAVAFAVVALVGLAAGRMIGARARSDRERVLNELIASADEAEALGRLDAALYQSEAALAHVRATGRDGSGRLPDLLARRDRASAREARARLEAVDALDPDRAVGESSTLARRARADRALAPMVDAIGAAVERSRRRQVVKDRDAARRALDAGDAPGAFAAAERLHDRAGQLAEAEAVRARDEARGLLESVVGRFGVALPPASGRFLAGSAEAYDAALDRPLGEGLRLHGFLVQPRRSPWRGLWDERAPFRATIEVAEDQDEYYLQSRNRTTQIEGGLKLEHRGRTIWQSRVVARTRAPLPDLPAYLAGHLATSNRRDPEVERRLHADALAVFVDLAARNLRGLPRWESAAKGP